MLYPQSTNHTVYRKLPSRLVDLINVTTKEKKLKK